MTDLEKLVELCEKFGVPLTKNVENLLAERELLPETKKEIKSLYKELSELSDGYEYSAKIEVDFYIRWDGEELNPIVEWVEPSPTNSIEKTAEYKKFRTKIKEFDKKVRSLAKKDKAFNASYFYDYHY